MAAVSRNGFVSAFRGILVWTIVLASLAAAGILIGEIGRSALCNGPWICK